MKCGRRVQNVVGKYQMWYQVSNVNVSNVAVECKMCGSWQKVSRAENLRQWLGRCPSPARNEITLLKNTLLKNTSLKNTPLKNTFLKKYTFEKYTF